MNRQKHPPNSLYWVTILTTIVFFGCASNTISIIRSIENGNLADIERHVHTEYEACKNCYRYYSPLHIAVLMNRKEIIEFLIPKITADEKMSALKLACTLGEKDVFLLLSKHIDINAATNRILLQDATSTFGAFALYNLDSGHFPLSYSFNSIWGAPHKEIIKLLIEKGATIDAQNDEGETALMNLSNLPWGFFVPEIYSLFSTKDDNHAVMMEFIYDMTNLLLSKGADPNIKNNNGTTVLMLAAESFNKKVIELLVEKGADINAKDNDGNSALMRAKKMLKPVASEDSLKSQLGWADRERAQSAARIQSERESGRYSPNQLTTSEHDQVLQIDPVVADVPVLMKIEQNREVMKSNEKTNEIIQLLIKHGATN
jgi:hypothetical protein